MTASLAKTASDHMSDEEWTTRIELAAAYRLVAMNGWMDGVANHLSARVPGEEAFLINPFGLRFTEVTASNLVKIDIEGNILSPTEYKINPAGFVVHSAVHAARPDAGCVMHLHTSEAVAVSSLEEGLLPLNQNSMLICEHIAYHEFEGVALNLEERERLAADLGDKNFMLLRNHGPLTVGATIGEAYCRMDHLQRCCVMQVMTLSMGRPIRQPSDQVRRRTAELGRRFGDQAWAAFRRELDAVTTDYMR
jgi:ribulose-5-phosphate 4-epimerase/fuculose-1-phosphate aldolase